MDRFVTFEDFAAYLDANKVRHNIDHDRHVVELTVNAPPLPSTIFVKWEPALSVFTFVQFMIENVPTDRIRDLETAIVRLNTVMELGGFSYDYQRNRMLCRLTVPVFAPDGITPASFQRAFQLVVFNARAFVPVFKRIIEGANGADVETITKETLAKIQAPAAP